jgi:hypothetical protein
VSNGAHPVAIWSYNASAPWEDIMEALIIITIIAVLALFDALAIRYGADSRILDNSRPNWW